MPLSLKRLFVRKKSNVNPLTLLSFNSKFPKAQKVLWQQVDIMKWQVHFYLDKNDFTALYNYQGKWMETASLVTWDKVPLHIKDKFKETYNEDGILQIYYVESPINSLYEIKWHNGVYAIKLIYDDTGKILGRLIV